MKKKDKLDNIICECGYQNKRYNIKKYGTCLKCKKVLDPRVRFHYCMYNKLRLWRKK